MAWCMACAVMAAMWFAWAAIFRIDEDGQLDRGVQADELTRDEIELNVPASPLGTTPELR